ncbi:MAG: hypothetical protein AB9903_00655 [Vulcanimicrobiota bacterium]
MKKTAVLLIILSIILLEIVAGPASAVDITGSGSQTRGGPGKNAQLTGKPFVILQQSIIAEVKGNGKGFWIQDATDRSIVRRFDNNRDAINVLIPKGTYLVYPNLHAGQAMASVAVTFRYSGAALPSPSSVPAAGSVSPAPSATQAAGQSLWTITFSDNRSFQYDLNWKSDTFTGQYRGISNPSTFTGRILVKDGRRYIKYTQFDRTRNYTADYEVVEIVSGLWRGTFSDVLGNRDKIELRGSLPPQAAAPSGQQVTQKNDPIVGSWLVNKKYTLTFLADGTIVPMSEGTHTWERTAREFKAGHPTYYVRFNSRKKTNVTHLYLSRDGRKLYSVLAGASSEWAERISR